MLDVRYAVAFHETYNNRYGMQLRERERGGGGEKEREKERERGEERERERQTDRQTDRANEEKWGESATLRHRQRVEAVLKNSENQSKRKMFVDCLTSE